MLIFGHLGIGRTLVHPWRDRLPLVPLVVGIFLPDVIDKPLYYLGISDVFSCTRTIGHTGLLAALVFVLGVLRRSATLRALGAGMATHVLLDNVLETGLGEGPGAAWIAATWPLHGPEFYRVTFGMREHVLSMLSAPVLICEAIGLVMLWATWRRSASRGGGRIRTTVARPDGG